VKKSKEAEVDKANKKEDEPDNNEQGDPSGSNAARDTTPLVSCK